MKTLHFYLPFLDEEQDILSQFLIRRSSILSFIKCCESELDYTRFLSEREIKYDRKMQLLDHLTQLYDEIYDIDQLVRMFKFNSAFVINVYNRDYCLINTFNFSSNDKNGALKVFLRLNGMFEIQFHHFYFDNSINIATIDFIHI